MSLDVIENPTWEYPIRSFFNDIDINHMLTITRGGLNLGKYEDVTLDKWREEIYERISGKTISGEDSNKPRMPTPPSPPWSDEMIALYKKWLDNGCPIT